MQQFPIKAKNLILNGSIGLDCDAYFRAEWDMQTTGTMQIIQKIILLNFSMSNIFYWSKLKLIWHSTMALKCYFYGCFWRKDTSFFVNQQSINSYYNILFCLCFSLCCLLYASKHCQCFKWCWRSSCFLFASFIFLHYPASAATIIKSSQYGF